MQQENFWIGPSSVRAGPRGCRRVGTLGWQGARATAAHPTRPQEALIHLGAKFSPCMRQDPQVHSFIRAAREREKHSACCVRNDRSGCVQTSEEECSVGALLPPRTRPRVRVCGSEQGPPVHVYSLPLPSPTTVTGSVAFGHAPSARVGLVFVRKWYRLSPCTQQLKETPQRFIQV